MFLVMVLGLDGFVAVSFLLYVVVISELEGFSSPTFVFGLEGLTLIGVWDGLDCWTHYGHGTV